VTNTRGRVKKSIFHSERSEDMRVAIGSKGFSGNPLEDFPQDLKIDIAISETYSRRATGFFIGDPLESLFGAGPVRLQI
jgi:hypothetical protein